MQRNNWTLRVCQTLRAHYGAYPGMYTSARMWEDNLKGHAAGELSECPLWLAKPWPWETKTGVHLDGAPGRFPLTIPQFGDQTNYCMYQYQGDALNWPGFDKTVDANRFHSIEKGAQGTFVSWIQRRLGVSDDGDFGPITEAAVKAFQCERGLVDDGVVGPATFAPLSWVE